MSVHQHVYCVSDKTAVHFYFTDWGREMWPKQQLTKLYSVITTAIYQHHIADVESGIRFWEHERMQGLAKLT